MNCHCVLECCLEFAHLIALSGMCAEMEASVRASKVYEAAFTNHERRSLLWILFLGVGGWNGRKNG